MSASKGPPIHPGEILRELYVEPLSLTPYALAKALLIPRTRLERLVAEKVGVTADTALRLAKHFRTTPEFWLNLQAAYDLKRQAALVEDELSKIEEVQVA